MTIKLDSLPLHIYNKIPLSIKSYKNEYELVDLPFEIQQMVEEYQGKSITYNTVYDCLPIISEFGDFKVIDNVKDLIKSYIKNYFNCTTGSYPFNGLVGNELKRLLSTKDTVLQSLYLSEALDNMIRLFNGSYKEYNLTMNKVDTSKKSIDGFIEVNLSLDLKIEGQDSQVVNVTV